MIPARYKFLEEIGTLPKMVVSSLSYLGLKEYPGKGSNPVIMNMAKELQVGNIYKDDDISWCAVYQCYLCLITGKPQPFKAYEILRAASFKVWGNEVPKGQEMLGDTMIFARPGGNHVGLYIAETPTTYIILGGNQSNSVSFTEIKKDRLTACRRFYATAPPASVKKYFLSSEGKISTNEN